jgi:general secretion pathway protein N
VVESLRPLTLLLGAAALWALCLLVLALGGLGEHFPPPEPSGHAPPLPKVSLAPTRSRLGAWETYAEVGARPLMTEERRPAAVTAMASDAGPAELDVTLTSVMITPRVKLAVFTDNKGGGSHRVRLGEVVEGSNWRLLSLDPRQAVLEGPGGQRVLPLRVYDGSGGEAPTPVADAEPTQAGPAVQPVPANPPPRSPPAPPVAQNASPAATVSKPDPEQMSQEQQVEAIRQRIEARRAQMRAEAEAAQAATNDKNR